MADDYCCQELSGWTIFKAVVEQMMMMGRVIVWRMPVGEK